ncbi:hypothetical protein NCS52_00825700 [Fusarium sp. LHS14.1]|nr:hypothetical protein NCS52_00825700 [Fusarium sp. LHS14.1]
MPHRGRRAEHTNSGRRGRRPHALTTDGVAQNVPFVMDGIAELDIEGINLDGGDMYGYPPIAQMAPFVVAANPVPRLAPASAPAPTPRRTMIVVVLYEIPPQNGQVGAEGRRFHLDRDNLFTLLPRTRFAVRRGALDLRSFFLPEDMEPHPPSIIHRALHFLFSHLEEHSRTGTLDMFGTAEQQIEHGSVRTSVVKRWAAMVQSRAKSLEWPHGNPAFCERHILNFFELLIQDIHNLIGWDETTILFEAFAGVFRTERRDLTSQLNRIWDRFDPEVQEQLLRDMRRALPAEGIDGMAHRMYRALGY